MLLTWRFGRSAPRDEGRQRLSGGPRAYRAGPAEVAVMRVTFHGVRGSVPTPGPSTVRYGGDSACTEIRLADGTLIVLDAGTGIRELGNQLLRRRPAQVIG